MVYSFSLNSWNEGIFVGLGVALMLYFFLNAVSWIEGGVIGTATRGSDKPDPALAAIIKPQKKVAPPGSVPSFFKYVRANPAANSGGDRQRSWRT